MNYVIFTDRDGKVWILKKDPYGYFFRLCEVNGLSYARMICKALEEYTENNP